MGMGWDTMRRDGKVCGTTPNGVIWDSMERNGVIWDKWGRRWGWNRTDIGMGQDITKGDGNVCGTTRNGVIWDGMG